MKRDITSKIYDDVFNIKDRIINFNKEVKSIILKFDGKPEYIVDNNNFGTRRKYMDFTEGRKKAGLHPLQIIVTDFDIYYNTDSDKEYIDRNGSRKKISYLVPYEYYIKRRVGMLSNEPYFFTKNINEALEKKKYFEEINKENECDVHYEILEKDLIKNSWTIL